ncbi:hypothetical protein CBF23_003225 [Marinomonas agarivorans]|nr:hypothetical protein CBF23_003225 [Marinomonas agarivorans]
MGGKSSSRNTTNNHVTNYSLQGMEDAETVVAGNNNTVTTTDHGAVEGAFGFGETALEFGNDVISVNERVTNNALSQNTALAGKIVDFSSNAIENNIEFSQELLNKNIASNANSTNAIKDLAKSLKSGSAIGANVVGAVVVVVGIGVVLLVMTRGR